MGFFKHTDTLFRSRAAFVCRALAIAAALAGAGCTTGSVFTSSTERTTASSSIPWGDRISSLFGGGSQTTPATEAAAQPSTPTSDDFDCPRIDIRPGASTLLVNSKPGESDALGLRYQGSFVRAARECRVIGKDVNIRIGVQGRIILGPSGIPGGLTVPLRLALLRETVSESTPLWSKLYTVDVTIPPNTQSVNFTHVSDDLTIAIPDAAQLADWVVYIGFDPAGAQVEKKKKPPARPRRARNAAVQ
jgi:hypothetical protein